MTTVRYLGHSVFAIEDGGKTALVDPWLTNNPKAATTAAEVAADVILLTHGHLDHIGDTVKIAKRTSAPVVAITEIAYELDAEGVQTMGPNIGGTVNLGWMSVKLTPALHTSTTPNGTVSAPAGLLIEVGDKRIYNLGDTDVFSDLALPKQRGPIHLALIPIGGYLTMDRHDAVVAAGLVGADRYIPCHYGTMPALETDPHAFKTDVERAGHGEVTVLDPGQEYEL